MYIHPLDDQFVTDIAETIHLFVLSAVEINVNLYNYEKYLRKFSTNSRLQKCHTKKFQSKTEVELINERTKCQKFS
jgi:hypothetical protein